jgi:hypothetical protein
MTATAELLDELRLLRAMGEEGRTAAARALRSARLGRRPENPSDAASGAAVPTAEGGLPTRDPMKGLVRMLDAAVVAGGGTSIFVTKPRGALSTSTDLRLKAWADATPRRHANAPGRKPEDEPEGVR